MKVLKLFDVVKLILKIRLIKNHAHKHGDIVGDIQIRKTSFCAMASDGDWRWIDVLNDRDFLWEIVC
jgi:hypothetical protein